MRLHGGHHSSSDRLILCLFHSDNDAQQRRTADHDRNDDRQGYYCGASSDRTSYQHRYVVYRQHTLASRYRAGRDPLGHYECARWEIWRPRWKAEGNFDRTTEFNHFSS